MANPVSMEEAVQLEADEEFEDDPDRTPRQAMKPIWATPTIKAASTIKGANV